jgi:hypothetical protein
MRWFRSRVDRWVVPVLAIAPLACLVSLVAALRHGEGILPAAASVAFVAALYVGLVFPLRYGIGEDALVVRHGLVRQRIPLAAIVEVRPSRSLLSAPALSLDRLEVRADGGLLGGAVISPEEREAFLDELARRAGLRREGERLVRA